jgi:hypothetical protein
MGLAAPMSIAGSACCAKAASPAAPAKQQAKQPATPSAAARLHNRIPGLLHLHML